MSWLTYDKELDKVVIADEAMGFDEVKKIYRKDRRNESKPYFNKVITYIYHAYATVHGLSNIFPAERKKRVCNAYFNGEDVASQLENDADVVALIDLYKKDSGTITERFYEGLKPQMEDLLNHINSIPMTRKQRVKKKINVEFIDTNGNQQHQEVDINVMIEIDNSEEKLKAFNTADKLIDLEQKMKVKVIQERKDKKKNTRRMFDHI